MEISTVSALAAANAVVDLVDAGASASKLIIYSGTKPAAADTAITDQVVLVSFDLPDPAFGDAADSADGGKATMNAIAPVNASATGTASFFRLVNGNGVVVLQGTVSATAGAGDLKMNSTSITAGVQATVISFSYAQPK